MSTSATSTAATPAQSVPTPTTHNSLESDRAEAGEKKNFSPLVQQFLDYLRLEKHFSDYTVKSYGADLIQFGQFLMGDIGASHAGQPRTGTTQDERQVAVEPLTIREFLAYLYAQNYTKSTTCLLYTSPSPRDS